MENKIRDIDSALLDAIWIMRWNENKTAMSAVLTVEEAYNICKNIIKELDDAGYKIVSK